MKYTEFYLPSLLLTLHLPLLNRDVDYFSTLCLSIVKPDTLKTEALQQKYGRKQNLSAFQNMLDRQSLKNAKGETLLFNFQNLEAAFTFIHVNHCALIYIIYIIHITSRLRESGVKFLRDI